ncbi:unnamed protein product, partial [marine sediment metagenome]
IEYGTTLLVAEGQATPLVDSHSAGGDKSFEANTIGTGDPEIYRAYDENYSRCSAAITVATNAGGVVSVTSGLQFATTAEITAWANANVAQAGGVFTQTARIHLYDTVSASIEPVKKVIGVNSTFRRYGKPDRFEGHAGATDPREALREAWIEMQGSFPYPTTARWLRAGNEAFVYQLFLRRSDSNSMYKTQWESLVGVSGSMTLAETSAVTAVDQGTRTFTCVGSGNSVIPGASITIAGSTGNDGTYTI